MAASAIGAPRPGFRDCLPDAAWVAGIGGASRHHRPVAPPGAIPTDRLPAGGGPDAVLCARVKDAAGHEAFSRRLAVEIAQDDATGVTPPAPMGVALVFGRGDFGGPSPTAFAYRADALGYTRRLGAATNPRVECLQFSRLTGTTGRRGLLTVSAYRDGKLYVENRLPGPSRRVCLHLIGARP